MSLSFYYGEECQHCHVMLPLVDKLIAEGFVIEKFETWHNEDNAEQLIKADRGLCGGVPFMINTDSHQFICGATDEKTLRAWASGEKVD